MEQFKIIKKCIDGIDINGYTIVGADGKERLLKVNDIVTLCKKDLISNAKVILDTDSMKEVVYITDDKIIESTTKYKKNMNLHIVCRIIASSDEGKSTERCIGYIVKDANGKSYKISTNKAWKLALNNNIVDVEAKIINRKKTLVSKDSLLSTVTLMSDNNVE